MKSFLKLARESITGKDFESALNYAINGLDSEEVTEGDKASVNKYNLLVFKALSLHNLGRDQEAIESYETAGMIHPELPLAWQGLISLYEKGIYDASKKIKPLENLVRIVKANGDAKKHYELLQKLIDELKACKLYDDALKHFKWLMTDEAIQFYKDVEEYRVDTNGRLRAYVDLIEAQEANHIVKEIDKRKFRLGAGTVQQIRYTVETELALSSPLDSLYRDLIGSLPEVEGNLFREKLAKRIYLKLPSMTEKSAALVELLQICKDNGGKDAELTEILLDLSDIADYNKRTISQYSNLDNGKYVEAAKYFIAGEIVEFTPIQQSVFSLYNTCNILLKNEEYDELLKQLSVLNTLISSMSHKYGVTYPLMKHEINQLEILALVNLEKYELARSKLSLMSDEDELFDTRIKVYDALSDHEASIALLRHRLASDPENVDLLSMLGWEYFKIKAFEQALEFLSKAEAKTPEDAEILYRLGRVHWSMDDKPKSLNCFLRSVKSNLEHAGSFLYLGLYYDTISDTVRAEKCFHKALRLDEDLVEAAVNLAKVWIARAWNHHEQHQEASKNVIDLLSVYSSSNLRDWSLWKYLGIAYSWNGQRQPAITAFQNALKGEHSNELACLQLLAEAYRADGKLTAALKAYARAVTVDPACMMARIGHATILMETGKYEEAVVEFEAILTDIDSRFIAPIRFQIAHACSQWFKELVLAVEMDMAVSVATKGLGLLAETLEGSKSLYGWRTAASLSFFLHHFSKRKDLASSLSSFRERLESFAVVPGNDVCDSIMAIDNPWLRLSGLSHFKCLSLCSASETALQSLLYSELAQVFYQESKLPAKTDQLILADGFCNQAVELASGNWGAWNLSGLIAMEQGRYSYSQHSFIMALESAPAENTSAIWMNLAELYRRNKDMELVGQAIEKAQMANVENPLAWFALAQLAYEGTSPKLHPEEKTTKAFELLGEAVGCTQASLHVDINLAYAVLGWERLKFLTGSDRKELLGKLELALQRIVNLDPSHLWALHTLALIKEQLGADAAVVRSLLERCIESDEHRDIVMANLVRILVRCGDFEGALKLGAVPQDEPVRLFRALAKSRISGSPADLKPFTLKAFHDQAPCLWKLAIWESAKINLLLKIDITDVLNEAAVIAPTAQVVLGAKFMNALVNEKGGDEVEALLLGLIELMTEPIELPHPGILAIIAGYLSGQGCHLEAFEFLMSVLENNLSDTRLWDFLIAFYDSFKGFKDIDQTGREKVTQALREWLDIRVPQLSSRPKMEEMEAYSDRLFPKTVDDGVIAESVAFPPPAEKVKDDVEVVDATSLKES